MGFNSAFKGLISCTRSFWIYHMQMMAKNMEGSGIAINICITCRNVITAYLISQQHDNCWSQTKPVPGVPDKSLQSASKWRQTRLFSRWGQTLLPTRDFMGLLLKGCWWRPWHMIRVGLEQKRSHPNSNCYPSFSSYELSTWGKLWLSCGSGVGNWSRGRAEYVLNEQNVFICTHALVTVVPAVGMMSLKQSSYISDQFVVNLYDCQRRMFYSGLQYTPMLLKL
jgi:hypothetical protein